jgi:hypothetical protein
MKNIWILGTMAVLMAMSSCKKQDEEIYAPSSKLEGINDEWVLTQVNHYDPSDIEKEMVLDISELFVGQNIELDINSKDFTFRFNSENPLFFGTSGIWSFDNNEAPSKIEFKTINSNNDTTAYSCKLNRTIRTIDRTLEFELQRTCESGTPTNNYQFKFRRK